MKERFWKMSLCGIVLVLLLFTACSSKAAKAVEKVELGQKYLTELNYTEAVASFTEAIGLDPENIPAYMGRAEAYVGLKQYDDAKADYTTAIEKTANQPYTQAEAYVGRAEVNELTTANEDALADYEAASTALDTVDVEKITDVTEQMLEALKIKIYNACARLKAFFGQNEAAAADYTSALDSLDKLPEDTDVLDVKATKIVSYTGRTDANAAQEKYEEVLPDYDALITLGEDKAADRDAILSAMSLAKSKAGDLHSSDSWLDEVNHTDYAASIQLTNAESVLKQAAELAQADGTKAYDKVKEIFSTEEAKAALQSLLARGYQLRYYDANGKMLAVYANETAWADVNVEENGTITAEALTAADSSAEDIGAVSLSKLYVYYGGYEGRSREGEGLWFILNPAKTDLTAETYTWENDKPKGDFKKKEVPKPTAVSAPTANVQMTSYGASQTLDSVGFPGWSSQATVTYGIGGTTVRIQEVFYDNGVQDIAWDTTFVLSQPLTAVSKGGYSATFYAPVGTVVKRSDGYGMECWNEESGKTLTLKSGKTYGLNYAGLESYGVNFAAK
jgi:tetratricopeptide (TPR) repeat protein